MILNQTQSLSLQQKLSPQQIQMIKLLELPAAMLEQRIKQEIEENIVLEEEQPAEESEQPQQISMDEYLREDDTPSYKSHINNFSKGRPSAQHPDFGRTLVSGVARRATRLPQSDGARDATRHVHRGQHRQRRLSAPRPRIDFGRHRLLARHRDVRRANSNACSTSSSISNRSASARATCANRCCCNSGNCR